MVNLISMYR
ncbi:hypothetical protein F383_13982 [Gossypium arboreum]|uniref:Uncharacterized protein n=1 Tax=Gossypium arboreum TaxID=29729 RepID=A0A0B0NCM2_GOSAR|nr:hypothetical protein F383_13982 [Gossypium arboreum]